MRLKGEKCMNQPYMLLLPIGLILLFSKLFALSVGKVKLPQVIGYLIAGLILGTITFIPNQSIFTSYTIQGINGLAKIGVVLILFTAGLETDLNKIKSVGKAAAVITSLGVIVPIGLGALIAFLFFPNENLYSNIYYGVILSATSVSISVATLKEMGKLDTKVGSAIVSAAIIDDVVGIICLSLIISLAGGKATTTYVDNPGLNIFIMILIMISFFALSILMGFVIRKIFNWLGKKYPHHIRIPIFSLAFCFIWAYLAERFFHIADITGAYIAGLILSSTNAEKYIDHRAESAANMIFAPIFFASIALKMYSSTSIDFSNMTFVWFGICWVLVGILSKVLGAGLGGIICKYNFKDSTKIGVGMMARAEVLIVCAQTGVDTIIGYDSAGNAISLISPMIMPFTLILIILTSFLTPIFLKLLYKGETNISQEVEKEVSVKSQETASK